MKKGSGYPYISDIQVQEKFETGNDFCILQHYICNH